jgi:hypothetical protein
MKKKYAPLSLALLSAMALFAWADDSCNAPVALDAKVTADVKVTADSPITADNEPMPYAGPVQRYAVTSRDLTWVDNSRQRVVPIKIYTPSGEGPFPVILFSPGLGRSRDDCGYLGIHWASCGYVSVFVQHKGSDNDVLQGTVRPKKQLREAFDDPKNIRNRPRDIIFVISRLDQLQQEGSSLGRLLDMQHIGVSGHDFGAQTALGLAGQVLPGEVVYAEPRIKAVVAMSAPVPLGQVPLSVAYSDICTPCLHITGTDDNSIVATTQASQRRLPFDYTRGADQFLVIFKGADHMTYSGHVFASLNGRSDAMFQRLIARSSTAFWDAYLKDNGTAKHWLADDGLHEMLGAKASVEKKIGEQKAVSMVPGNGSR